MGICGRFYDDLENLFFSDYREVFIDRRGTDRGFQIDIGKWACIVLARSSLFMPDYRL